VGSSHKIDKKKDRFSSIEKIQRRAPRVVSNDHRKTSSVSKMLKELDFFFFFFRVQPKLNNLSITG